MNTSPIDFNGVSIGDELPVLAIDAIDRKTLALFAGASGDHNPVHIDIDQARAFGMPDVFAQGMLLMAWLGRLLTNWVPQRQLRRFDVRFVGITHLQNSLRCTGCVTERLKHRGEECIRVELQSENQFGQIKVVGHALISTAECEVGR